jgi:hypothetical protein
VQSVVAPQPRIGGDRVRLEIDDTRAVPCAELADARVESGQSRRDTARHGHHRREVGHGEGEHGGAGAGERAQHRGEIGGDRVGVEAARDDVVGAAEDGGEIGPQRERARELLVAHLPGAPAAHREIGVEHPALRRGDALGEPVRPAAEAAAAVRVVEPLGRAVADGDVALELSRGHGTILDDHGMPPRS